VLIGGYRVLAINRAQPDHIVAGDPSPGAWGLAVSLDGGNTFSKRWPPSGRPGSLLSIGLDPLNTQVIYVGGTLDPVSSSGGALFKTTDGGLSWTEITGTISAGSVDQIDIPPANPGLVVVRAASRLYRSFDTGETWDDITPPGGVSTVRVDPEAPGGLYAAGLGGGFFVSETGGGSWSSLGTAAGGLPIRSLGLIPCVKRVFAATSGGGVFRNCVEPKNLVAIEGSGRGTTVPPPGLYGFEDGATLDITAVPAKGYTFKAWAGGAAGPDNPLRLTVTSDLNIWPEFRLAAPEGFAVVQAEARSLLLRQYVNILTWRTAEGVAGLVGYKVYLLGDGAPVLLATLDTKASTYWHRGVVKGRAYSYALAAYDDEGTEGETAIARIGASPAARRTALRTAGIRRSGKLK
jgi:hypothetical protein